MASYPPPAAYESDASHLGKSGAYDEKDGNHVAAEEGGIVHDGPSAIEGHSLNRSLKGRHMQMIAIGTLSLHTRGVCTCPHGYR